MQLSGLRKLEVAIPALDQCASLFSVSGWELSGELVRKCRFDHLRRQVPGDNEDSV